MKLLFSNTGQQHRIEPKRSENPKIAHFLPGGTFQREVQRGNLRIEVQNQHRLKSQS